MFVAVILTTWSVVQVDINDIMFHCGAHTSFRTCPMQKRTDVKKYRKQTRKQGNLCSLFLLNVTSRTLTYLYVTYIQMMDVWNIVTLASVTPMANDHDCENKWYLRNTWIKRCIRRYIKTWCAPQISKRCCIAIKRYIKTYDMFVVAVPEEHCLVSDVIVSMNAFNGILPWDLHLELKRVVLGSW